MFTENTEAPPNSLICGIYTFIVGTRPATFTQWTKLAIKFQTRPNHANRQKNKEQETKQKQFQRSTVPSQTLNPYRKKWQKYPHCYYSTSVDTARSSAVYLSLKLLMDAVTIY